MWYAILGGVAAQLATLGGPAISIRLPLESVTKARRAPKSRRSVASGQKDLVSRGGWDKEGTWVPVPFVDAKAAELLFRHKVIALLRDEELLYRRKASSHFGRAETPFDPLDFLARLLMHIPQPKLHTVRYYGHYSSVARAHRRALEDDGSHSDSWSAEGPTVTERRRLRRAWAQMIRRIYEVDALTCQCGARMRILSFILDPRVVTKILRHLAANDAAQQRAPPSSAVASQ